MDEMRVLTKFAMDPNQCDIKTYEANGGYQALKKTVGKIPAEQIVDAVKRSELRGRGGAGFMTGSKWGFIPKDPTPSEIFGVQLRRERTRNF